MNTLTAGELFTKYCGKKVVLKNKKEGIVVGYYKDSETSLILGISNSETRGGWHKNILERIIDKNRSNKYVFSAKADDFKLFWCFAEKDITYIDEYSIKPEDDMVIFYAEEWVKNLENYDIMEEEDANILLNAFILGAVCNLENN